MWWLAGEERSWRKRETEVGSFRDFFEGWRPSQRQEEIRWGSTLKEGDSGIISIGWFFHVHAILLCFLDILRFYFGVWMCLLGTLICFYGVLSSLAPAFQPIFRTLFWDFVCGTGIHVLFFFLKPPLKFILAHLLYLSWLVDIRIEARMGSFYSYYWCYVFVVSPGSFVLSIAIAKCHLHLYPIAPPHNHAHPQNPSSFTPHTIHSHHPSHPPSSHFHYSPAAWSSMHIATLIFSL